MDDTRQFVEGSCILAAVDSPDTSNGQGALPTREEADQESDDQYRSAVPLNTEGNQAAASPPSVELLGMQLAAITESELLARTESDLSAGKGGWLVTANLDILHHFVKDESARRAYLAADLRVADGMPLVWAARLQGDDLPERIAGSTLCVPLLRLCSKHEWPVALIGGAPSTAEQVAQTYQKQLPNLSIAADSSLRFSTPPTPAEVEAARAVIRSVRARVVLVGLGSPKQEYLIEKLRVDLEDVWFVGIGGSFSFLTGDTRRAPEFLQRAGLEWLHRLAQDPQRLAQRYLRDNLPFGLRLLSLSAVRGVRRALSKQPN